MAIGIGCIAHLLFRPHSCCGFARDGFVNDTVIFNQSTADAGGAARQQRVSITVRASSSSSEQMDEFAHHVYEEIADELRVILKV